MPESKSQERWRPTRATLIAGVVVITGFALSEVSWWFFLLVALGTFGPGVLRELGLLQDQDEFQRRAAHRAGYHAFLTTGMVAFFVVSYVRSGDRVMEDAQELATLFLALLWFTWFLSSLLSYWGAQKASSRILIAFGFVWLAFTIVSNLGPEWTGWAALLLHPLLAAPFFLLAWLSGRRPRITGLLLVAVSILMFQSLRFFQRDMSKINDGVTVILFIGPLLASGVALLTGGKKEEETEEGLEGTPDRALAEGE